MGANPSNHLVNVPWVFRSFPGVFTACFTTAFRADQPPLRVARPASALSMSSPKPKREQKPIVKSKEVTSAVFSETCLARMSRVSAVRVCMYIYSNSFSYGVFAIRQFRFRGGAGAASEPRVPGRFGAGSGTESGAGSGQCFKEVPGRLRGIVSGTGFVMREARVPGRFPARFQGGSVWVLGGPWQERTENDLVGDRESWTVPLVNQ